MKIVVTGATGYVGRNLVPLLVRDGHEVLLVGRDQAKINRMFPGARHCVYADLAHKAEGYDILLHLAVLNNNSRKPLEDFRKVNVETAVETAKLARDADIGTLVHFSSTHALDPANTSAYAISKREAAEELAKLTGIEVVTIHLPYVYNPRFSDRLSWLNKLPGPIRGLAFHAVAALKPTVSIDRIAGWVASAGQPGFSAGTAREVIVSDGQAGNPVYAACKRMLDVLFALAVLIFLWWLLVLIWIFVRLESRGPGIFAQERVGRNGRVFTCYKFRTMKIGTANLGTHEVSVSAVTRLGQVLRKLKLDELPQILNIFRNEISLIGPRPCLPVQSTLIEARRRLGVLTLKPGISGLAQVNGVDMSDPERLARWDARYMGLQSLLLDLRIIVATALGGGNGDRVAR